MAARPPIAEAAAQAKASVKDLGSGLLDRVIKFGSEQIESGIGKLGKNLTGKLGEMVSGKLAGIGQGGKIGLAAAAGAAQAKLEGKNPIMGAIRAGVGAIPTGVKVALIVGLVLALLLAPVLAVVLLVALLVFGLIFAVRQAAG